NNIDSLLTDIIDAAIEITGADMGDIQLFNGEDELKIVTGRGFDQAFTDFFNTVHECQTACSAAIMSRERVIVEDITQSPVFSDKPAPDAALAAGIRAVQSTPLVSRSGRLLGIFSTHYRTQRRPDERDLVRLDLLARQAADLIERNQAEEEMRKTEARVKVAAAVDAERQRLYSVLETMPAMICLLTPDYHVAFANRAFREKFGEANGRHCYEYCFGRTEPCDFCESLTPLKTGKPHHWEAIALDGSVIEAHDHPFTDTDGSRMVLKMDLDITRFRHAEKELKESRKHLEDLVRERTRSLEEAKNQAELYLDLMGHDINNLHQVALGYLELAQDMTPRDGEQSEFIDKSIGMMQRSAQLINILQKLQKHQEGMIQAQDVEVCGVLQDVQREFGSVHNKAVTLNTNGYDYCHVRANELLHDVFTNLVGNAIKHTRDQADITIDLDKVVENGRKYCRVMVEDNGPGIPDDLKPMVFNRLIKGTNRVKGMGLGLYLVTTLVYSYDGRVWVEDRTAGDYTKGAKFVVLLPAIDKEI
ncbi:MAG TPA: ATP-binding protein, partial [Methanocella sp.]|nr:ATP-binding protein [Methanocella sp.]